VASQNPLPAGKATIRHEFVYEGGGSGKGGVGTVLVNGEKYAQGKIEHTNGNLFSADDTADVGIDDSTPVDEGSTDLYYLPLSAICLTSVRAAHALAKAEVGTRESQKATARAKRGELDVALGDLNCSTNRLSRRVNGSNTWMGTKVQVDQVLHDGRRTNQLVAYCTLPYMTSRVSMVSLRSVSRSDSSTQQNIF
jgi:hypothetical protein